MSRPQRLIELLATLHPRRQTTAEALARGLGVSTRTVLRDVRTLVEAGIPVVTERGKYGGITLALSDVVAIDDRPWFADRNRSSTSPTWPAICGPVGGCASAISYRRSGAAVAEDQLVDPYGLLQRAGRWYLVADRNRQPRLYALVRLERWVVTESPRRLRAGGGPGRVHAG